MSYQKKLSKKPSIPIDAWEEIEAALGRSESDPGRPYSDLVAEQERLRVLDLLAHRLNVIGVRNVSS